MTDIINSSDFEDDDPLINNPFALSKTAGKRNADSILRNQVADRFASKKSLRTLTAAKGSPGSVYVMGYIANLWAAYIAGNDIAPGVCPTGEQVYRFIVVLVRTTKCGVRGRDVPALSTIQGYWQSTINYLTFSHRSFAQSYLDHDRRRIDTYLTQQVMAGTVFKGRKTRQWLGFHVLQQMVTKYVQNALDDGTLSWDLVIMRVLEIDLLAGLGARSGDLARTAGYTGDQYLKYGDISLILEEGGTSVQDLQGTVVLRYTKGYKRDEGVDHEIPFTPLQEPIHFLMCITKMLLCHALRNGQVYGKTVKEVLEHTAVQPNRTVRWKHPQAPVLCQIRGAHLVTERPAPAHALNTTVQRVARVAGIVVPVSAHNTRTGHARDVAYLSKTNGDPNVARAGKSLGHNARAEKLGLTDHYIGPMNNALNDLTAMHSLTFVDRKAPKLMAEKPMPVHRVSTWEIDQRIDAEGGDKTDRNTRQRATAAIKRDATENWRKEQEESAILRPKNALDLKVSQVIAHRTTAPTTPSNGRASESGPATRASNASLREDDNDFQDAGMSVTTSPKLPAPQTARNPFLREDDNFQDAGTLATISTLEHTMHNLQHTEMSATISSEASVFRNGTGKRQRPRNMAEPPTKRKKHTHRSTKQDLLDRISVLEAELARSSNTSPEAIYQSVDPFLGVIDPQLLATYPSVDPSTVALVDYEMLDTSPITDDMSASEHYNTEAIVNVLIGATEEGSEEDDNTDSPIDPDSLDSETPLSEPLLVSSSEDFIKFFSSVNTYKREDTGANLSELCAKGNSRDAPERFIHLCSICGVYKHVKAASMDRHKSKCTPEAAKAAKASKAAIAARPHGCDKCPSAYDKAHLLKKHISNMHDWQPKKCARCSNSETYGTYNAYAYHSRKEHNPPGVSLTPPCACPLVDICHSTKEFDKASALLQHLWNLHKVAAETAYQQYPWLKAARNVRGQSSEAEDGSD